MPSLAELKGMRQTLKTRHEDAQAKADRCKQRVKELDKEIADMERAMRAELEAD